MAAPHVAGVVALMRSIEPLITPFDIDKALNDGDLTEDLGNPTLYGNGLIDAVKAVNFAADGDVGSTVLDPFLRVDPGGLNYGFLADSFLLSVGNGGNDDEPLTVTGFGFTSDDGAPWLTVLAESVDGDGLGAYRATVDRSPLSDGLYTGTIQFVSTENTVDIPVLMQVGDPSDATANAGHHFVLLVDADTFENAGQVESNPTGGLYPFGFSAVPEGRYVLIAGTDSDGDFFICDPGEACGAFPTTETIVPIQVDTDRTGLEFVTGFRGGVGAAISGASSPGRGFPRN
jgi:serine protease